MKDDQRKQVNNFDCMTARIKILGSKGSQLDRLDVDVSREHDGANDGRDKEPRTAIAPISFN